MFLGSLAFRVASADAYRRTRERLRDLCDEVLWSFRIATNDDLISEQERNEARAFLSSMTPISR